MKYDVMKCKELTCDLRLVNFRMLNPCCRLSVEESNIKDEPRLP